MLSQSCFVISKKERDPLLVYESFCSLGLLNRLACFGWHVVFIMLRHHSTSVKNSIWRNLTFYNTAASVLEKIGGDSFINDGHTGLCVGNCKTRRKSVSLYAALLNEAAYAESLSCLNLLCSHVGWVQIESYIAVQRC